MFAAADFSVALLVFAGVVASALGAFFIAKRTNSGRVNTSEAAKLWDESTNMRHELREQVLALTTEIQNLKEEITTWRLKVAELETTVVELRKQVLKLDGVINSSGK